jgi:hypothetical protein
MYLLFYSQIIKQENKSISYFNNWVRMPCILEQGLTYLYFSSGLINESNRAFSDLRMHGTISFGARVAMIVAGASPTSLHLLGLKRVKRSTTL